MRRSMRSFSSSAARDRQVERTTWLVGGPPMCVSQLHRDTILVTDVVGRVEAALKDRWNAAGENLFHKINSLKAKGVDPSIIKMLQDLRDWRNPVIHHPRRELKAEDRTTFRQF